jgi:hypothetical protein
MFGGIWLHFFKTPSPAQIGFVFSTLPKGGPGRSNERLGSFLQDLSRSTGLGSLRKTAGGRESVPQKTLLFAYSPAWLREWRHLTIGEHLRS